MIEERERTPVMLLLGAGTAAGVMSGLLGVGGGLVLVPMLVGLAGFSQHRAHATSLAAIVPIAAAAALRFAGAGEVDLLTALFLSAGAIVGAQIGARIMHRMGEASLKAAFGCLLIVIGAVMVWP